MRDLSLHALQVPADNSLSILRDKQRQFAAAAGANLDTQQSKYKDETKNVKLRKMDLDKNVKHALKQFTKNKENLIRIDKDIATNDQRMKATIIKKDYFKPQQVEEHVKDAELLKMKETLIEVNHDTPFHLYNYNTTPQHYRRLQFLVTNIMIAS